VQGDIHYSAEPKILMTVLDPVSRSSLGQGARRRRHETNSCCRSTERREQHTLGDVAIDSCWPASRLDAGSPICRRRFFGGAAVLPFGGGSRLEPTMFNWRWNGCAAITFRSPAQRTGVFSAQADQVSTQARARRLSYIPAGTALASHAGSVGSATETHHGHLIGAR